jgi:DNA-binding GntR family transcriptional regulator
VPPAQPRTAVADEIRRRIQNGVYKPNKLLPTLEDLVTMTQGGASRNTVASAIKVLASEGYVGSVQYSRGR